MTVRRRQKSEARFAERQPAPLLSAVGEFGLIEQIKAEVSSSSRAEIAGKRIVGIGDDCAVLPKEAIFGSPDDRLLVTTDVLIEERHFSLTLSTAFELGWKALAVSLSDIAAMGGSPRTVLVTLQLRPDLSVEFVNELYLGMTAVLGDQVSIVGGDTVGASEFAIGTTVIGSAQRPVLRSGAEAGDDIWVSGLVGAGYVGLESLRRTVFADLSKEREAYSIERYRKPEPRLALGQLLSRRGLAKSMIDISDGMFQDLGHILEESKVSAEVELEAIPTVFESVVDRRTDPHAAQRTLARMASGGDDYELIFTAAEDRREELLNLRKDDGAGDNFPPLSRIGKILMATKAPADGSLIVVDQGQNRRTLEQFLSIQGLSGKGGYKHF